MSELAIRALGLTRSFETVRALDELSVEIPAGSVFGFLGPNGAGKTTTIRLLLGLIANQRKRSGAGLRYANARPRNPRPRRGASRTLRPL